MPHTPVIATLLIWFGVAIEGTYVGIATVGFGDRQHNDTNQLEELAVIT